MKELGKNMLSVIHACRVPEDFAVPMDLEHRQDFVKCSLRDWLLCFS